MSRPLTRLTTTSVATSAWPAATRRPGLRPSPGALTQTSADPADHLEDHDGPHAFWEYYVLAFC